MSEQKTYMFAAIDRTIERLIESPEEKRYTGARFVNWGSKNTYPFYIKGLCREVPTLRTVTLGLVDYICGDAVMLAHGLPGRADGALDRRGTKGREFVKSTATNAAHLGGFAWKITLNNDGTTGEVENLPIERIRSNDEGTEFYYSEKFDKGRRDAIAYPAWTPGTRCPESILFVKIWGEGVYPEPIFAASVKACETERCIGDYHLGNILRGFMGSYIVNFNGGAMPTEKQMQETERDFTEKFGGHKNAGRIMFSWNRDIASRTTLEKLEVSDYGEKYKTLSDHCRQQIFTAFRANPNLFGIATESNGFNSEEYESSFKLFNRTMVVPIQQQIIDALEMVTGEKGILTIRPFSIENNTQEVTR